MHIKIGTRGSKLALWQAHHVKDRLEAAGNSVELVLFKTTGDIRQQGALHELGERGLFTKALDDALLDGSVDIAVHSSKDIPSSVPDGLDLIASLKREDPRDVLLAVDPTVDLDNFSRSLVIGTSALRRQAFLHHYLPQCEPKLLRGNVDTRVAKLEAGEYDAIILAYAGVKRMGYSHLVRRKLNVNTFTPAPGQGSVAVMSMADFSGKAQVRCVLNHPETEYAIMAERSFLRTINGGCHTPIFSLGTVVGQTLDVQAGVASVDGTTILREEVRGHIDEAEELGRQLAVSLLNQGATKILNG